MGKQKPPAESVEWSKHAKRMWDRRADEIAVECATSFDAVWNDSVAVHYPPARDDTKGYYHRLADVVILARPDEDDPDMTAVVSVIGLQDRPPAQQDYVREQAIPNPSSAPASASGSGSGTGNARPAARADGGTQ